MQLLRLATRSEGVTWTNGRRTSDPIATGRELSNVCVSFYLLSRCMRPEGPWQRRAFSNITISRPKPLWVNLGLPNLRHPSSARQKKGRTKTRKRKGGKNHPRSAKGPVQPPAASRPPPRPPPPPCTLGPHPREGLMPCASCVVGRVASTPWPTDGPPSPLFPPQRKKESKDEKQDETANKRTPGKHYPTSRPGDAPPPASP